MNLHELAGRLDRVTWRGEDGFTARCPAHDDHNPSLSADLGDDGRLLVRCHADCPSEAVLGALKLEFKDLFAEKARDSAIPGPNRPRVVERYAYTDEAGETLFEVERFEPGFVKGEKKTFRQRHPDGRGGWVKNTKGVRRVLYRLPEVLAGIADEKPVFVVEGEKDVDALVALGYCATTMPGGVGGGWRQDYTDTLAGADVVVVADADDPGRRHAEKVRQALDGVANTVAVFEPVEGHKDVAEHLGAGFGVTDFVPVDQPPEYHSDDAPPHGDEDCPPDLYDDDEAVVTQVTTEAPDLFRTFTMRELLAEDLTWEWMVKGMFSRPTYGQIAGEMKTFKSYLLTFITLGIASGRPIFDRFEVEHPGPVVVYVGEGGRIPWTRRILRCAEAMGLTADDLADLPLFPTFDVAPVSSLRFDESLERDLDQHRPVLFALDPFYAYHGAEVKSSDLHQEGAHLNTIRGPVEEAGANLLIANHFNQSGAGNGLKRITMAGSGEWVDSWLLTSHREEPNVAGGDIKLRLDIGSRQWGGSTWDLNLHVGTFDHDTGTHDGPITWEIEPATGSVAAGTSRDAAKTAITRVISDHPGEFTRTQILEKVGGNKTAAQGAFDDLARGESIRWENISQPDKAGRMVSRKRWVGALELVHDAEAGQ